MSANLGDHSSVTKILDSGRVHPDCRDSDGATALILASSHGHLKTVRILISDGADVNFR